MKISSISNQKTRSMLINKPRFVETDRS